MRKYRNLKNLKKNHFSLIEVIVVIVIIALLSTIAVPRFMAYLEKANKAAAISQIKNFETAIEGFKISVGRPPTTEEGLQALIENPGNLEDWTKMLKQKRLPKDPWKNDYVYRCPGEDDAEYEIISYGKDGQPGGDDDISSNF